MRTVMDRIGLLAGVCGLVFATAVWAAAQDKALYTWTDKKGVVHMADSLEKVPAEYRSQAKRAGEGTPGENVVPEAPAPAPSSELDRTTDDASLKAQWQSRMLDAKRRLQYAEDKYQQLAKRKGDLQAQWGSAGAALPPQEVLDEMKNLDSDLASAKQEADKARDMIDNVIPDEARRAGIPPGWLREVQ